MMHSNQNNQGLTSDRIRRHVWLRLRRWKQLNEQRLLQSLEHEKGGVQVYQTALECARNKDLKKEWTKYFEQTQTHVKVLTDACQQLDIDPDEVTPGRQIVKHNGAGLVKAMKMALAAGSSAGAELVACECVVIAETKDHFDWEMYRPVC